MGIQPYLKQNPNIKQENNALFMQKNTMNVAKYVVAKKRHFDVNQANGTTSRSGASTSFVALRVEAGLRIRKLSRLFVEHN